MYIDFSGAAIWNKLTEHEKKPYNRLAIRHKNEYNRKMAIYQVIIALYLYVLKANKNEKQKANISVSFSVTLIVGQI